MAAKYATHMISKLADKCRRVGRNLTLEAVSYTHLTRHSSAEAICHLVTRSLNRMSAMNGTRMPVSYTHLTDPAAGVEERRAHGRNRTRNLA